MSTAMLLARCGEFVVAFPLAGVLEVVAAPVPGAPDPRCRGWRGLLAWRGAPVPLVDLRDRLGAPADDPPRHAVVCACGEARVALAVDHVDGLGTIEAAPGNATLPGVPRLARAGDRFAVILAPGDLFGAAEQALLAAERVA